MSLRPLSAGAVGGSLISFAAQLRQPEFTLPPASLAAALCECESWEFAGLDGGSVLVGVGLGLLIGPLVDILSVARQSWRRFVRTRLQVLARQDLYRLL